MSVPRVTTIDVDIAPGEELCITPLSDLHIESRAFDYDGFKRLMSERAELPHHRAVLLGDTMDLVVPVDLRRWRASTQDSSLAGQDAWLNDAVDLAVERLRSVGVQYDAIGVGNHEDEFLKRHGVSVVSMLARELRCAQMGYSGVIRYRLRAGNNRDFRIAWHHGAWGGRVVKGFAGARDWFRAFEPCQPHVCCYGHNHQTVAQCESRWRMTKAGKLEEYPVYYVCTSAWTESYSSDAKLTHYAERHGYMPTWRQTPLIRARIVSRAGGAKKRWALEYTVEV